MKTDEMFPDLPAGSLGKITFLKETENLAHVRWVEKPHLLKSDVFQHLCLYYDV
jgi:hypothetical protein